MPVLVLNHKGYSITLFFRQKPYYAGKPFELGKTIFRPGKTLCQILFEHLIERLGLLIDKRQMPKQPKRLL